jgi:hypothetical protein
VVVDDVVVVSFVSSEELNISTTISTTAATSRAMIATAQPGTPEAGGWD